MINDKLNSSRFILFFLDIVILQQIGVVLGEEGLEGSGHNRMTNVFLISIRGLHRTYGLA